MDKKEEIKEWLKNIIKENGTSIALKPSELETIFKKEFPDQEILFEVLVKTSNAGLPWSIISTSSDVVKEDEYKRLTEQMKVTCKITNESDAIWALDTWIEALGKKIEGKPYAVEVNQTPYRNITDSVPYDTNIESLRTYDGLEQDLVTLTQKKAEFEHKAKEISESFEKGEALYRDKIEKIKKYENEIEECRKEVEIHLASIGIDTNRLMNKVPDSTASKDISVNYTEDQILYYLKQLRFYSDEIKKSTYDTIGNSGDGCLTLLGYTFLIPFLIALVSAIFSRGTFWDRVGVFFGAFFGTLFYALIISAVVSRTVKRFSGKASDYVNFNKYLNLCRNILKKWDEKAKAEHTRNMDNLNIQLKEYEKYFQNEVEEIIKDIPKKNKKLMSLLPDVVAPWSNFPLSDLDIQNVKSSKTIPPFFRVGEISENFFGQSVRVPALIKFDEKANLIFETKDIYKSLAVDNVKSIILRLLASFPPGKIGFTFFDPVGLGNNVSEFMSLADYDEFLVNVQAWTEPNDINKRLQEITSHMEVVIQKYLRNQYKTIKEYNDDNKELAEPYKILVVFDFPTNFTEESVKRLVSIVNNGPRCGVYTIIVRDTAKKLPYGVDIADLYKNSKVVRFQDKPLLEGDPYQKFNYNPDNLPATSITKQIIETVGNVAKITPKIDVSYDTMLQFAGISSSDWWKQSTKDSLEIPIGLSSKGNRKIQYLSLGKGNNHYALVVGQTGSGKSNLLHVIITTSALIYSPEELELYLIDFKEGVEFKPYADLKLAHCKVIAIESEREFGISVLRRLRDEISIRSDLFKKAGENINSIKSYREKTGEKMPRILLIVDEFQVFFAENDEISTEAKQILDEIARQGRVYGIHYILSTQSLSGAASEISRSTLSQIETRIAFKCMDSDSRLILSDDNPAAKMLTRLGEAIYNDRGGLKEGNNDIQVALFKDEDKKIYYRHLKDLMNNKNLGNIPIIFEGNAPASFRECEVIKNLLNRGRWLINPKSTEAYIGEPISIKPTVSFCFKRQSSNNAMIVTKEERNGVALTISSILSLAFQYNPQDVEFHIVDLTNPDESWADLPENLRDFLPQTIRVYGKMELRNLLISLKNSLNTRLNSENTKFPEMFLILLGAHRARDLRMEETVYSVYPEKNKEEPLNEILKFLLREGPEFGIHVIAWFDTYSSLERILGRRDLQFFSMRVIGKMNSTESQSLIDDSVGSKIDKPNRLIYYDDEKPGILEEFRPFDLPTKDYIIEIGTILKAFK
jgi:hypothetical protein